MVTILNLFMHNFEHLQSMINIGVQHFSSMTQAPTQAINLRLDEDPDYKQVETSQYRQVLKTHQMTVLSYSKFQFSQIRPTHLCYKIVVRSSTEAMVHYWGVITAKYIDTLYYTAKKFLWRILL